MPFSPAPNHDDINGTAPNPDSATARAGFGALWDFATSLLGLTGDPADARAALEVPSVTEMEVAIAAGAAAQVDLSNVSSTITWNINTGQNAKLVLDGNKTLNITGTKVGWVTLVVTQMSPVKTITYGAGINHFGVGAGFTPDLGTAAGHKTVISGYFDGAELLTGNSPKHY